MKRTPITIELNAIAQVGRSYYYPEPLVRRFAEILLLEVSAVRESGFYQIKGKLEDILLIVDLVKRLVDSPADRTVEVLGPYDAYTANAIDAIGTALKD
jgi:hypothetical protein